MQKYKLLVLTDHTNHSAENSLYPLVRTMRAHPLCKQVDVASRGNEENKYFFQKTITSQIWTTTVDESFEFSVEGTAFRNGLREKSVSEYDFVWLRMPPPLDKHFLRFLNKAFPSQVIINNPDSIYLTGSKEFLINFPQICPPMKICRTIEDIIDFKNQFPIVLKPFREYGGKGIVRIDGDRVWEGKTEMSFDDFKKQIQNKKLDYLGVKFLKNVSKGDKRIIVVNGKIMGASLRLPAKDSWLCNVAMGGSSNYAEVDEDEVQIVETISPILSKMGIVMYGVDTLVGDDGRRILSEINTTSIGGLPQIAKMMNKPLLQEAADLMWNYLIQRR